jgi:hypothetical protein
MWTRNDYWTEVQGQGAEIDTLINEFNQEVGLVK